MSVSATMGPKAGRKARRAASKAEKLSRRAASRAERKSRRASSKAERTSRRAASKAEKRSRRAASKAEKISLRIARKARPRLESVDVTIDVIGDHHDPPLTASGDAPESAAHFSIDLTVAYNEARTALALARIEFDSANWANSTREDWVNASTRLRTAWSAVDDARSASGR